MEIEFEDARIDLKLPDVPHGWSITPLIPTVVRVYHSSEFDALAKCDRALLYDLRLQNSK